MNISDRMKRMHNCVGITIENKESFSGKLYNCYDKAPISYTDVDDLFNIINSFLDTVEFPAQKFRYRAFKKTYPTLKIVDIDPKEKLFDTMDLLPMIGNDSFILMVTARDNASWQGKIYSVALDEEYNFNSEVELIRILNK